jgi:hypothetical protein
VETTWSDALVTSQGDVPPATLTIQDGCAGDAVDFWRMEAVELDHLPRLRAEMKVPGDAWLQFEVMPQAEEVTSFLFRINTLEREIMGRYDHCYLVDPA